METPTQKVYRALDVALTGPATDNRAFSMYPADRLEYLTDAVVKMLHRELEAAAKWQALLASERIRIVGRTVDYNHLGLELWRNHPAAHPSEEYPQDQCRAALEDYVAHVRGAT